jgi:hypothetical protein
MDSRNPFFDTKRKSRAKCHIIIQQQPRGQSEISSVNIFEFCRYRFPFRALEATCFPQGKSGNVVRGALGLALRSTASPEEYARLFEPRKTEGALSGFHDLPRPFVARAAHLDGRTFEPGEQFFLDVHFFDVRNSGLNSFEQAFELWARTGVGPRRGRVQLLGAESLDAEDRPAQEPCRISLDAAPGDERIHRAAVRFLTPTELKSSGDVADRPEFGILFARLRDRIGALCTLYGAGPLQLAFREMGERAAAVRLRRLEIAWERVERRSARTGQTHPIGGFTGEAEYEGELAEFLPWLRAGRWSGVGRQTVWGKGDMRCVPDAQSDGY